MTARIPPLPPRAWPEGMRAALDALHPPKPRHPFPTPEPGRPKALNMLGTLAHHPELTAAYHAFNGHILFATTLSPRQRELLVLRVAARREAEYEWLQHTILAADAGLTPEDVARVQEGPDAAGWAPLDAAMLRAVDELIDDAMITDETWAALAAGLDRQQLMDLVFTVGAYELLAMAFKSFGIEIDADLEAWRR